MATDDQVTLHSIAATLRKRQWSLAVAESLTGGRIQSWITSISGSSDYFVGGLVAYSIERKIELLGVDRELAMACNGVSAEIAQQMARGVARLFRADCAIATTGYAEPSEPWGVTAPFAYCCAAVPDGVRLRFRTERFTAHGNRIEVQETIARHTIALLHELIAE